MVDQSLKNALKEMEDIFLNRIEKKFMGKHVLNFLNDNVVSPAVTAPITNVADDKLNSASKIYSVFRWLGSFFK